MRLHGDANDYVGKGLSGGRIVVRPDENSPSQAPGVKTQVIAGNTIGSDKKFLDHYMPELMENLHYRTIDVSTFKELARRWYPAVYLNRPPKNGGHRALADIIESLDELRYYRKAFMAPVPGPSEAEAKAIASEIQETSLLNKD